MFQEFGQCVLTPPSSSIGTVAASLPSERDINGLTLDPSLSTHAQEILQFCYYRLLVHGAQVSTHFHSGVTHVLIPSPTLLEPYARVQRIQSRVKLLQLGSGNNHSKSNIVVKIAYPEWIEESVRAFQFVGLTPTNSYVNGV